MPPDRLAAGNRIIDEAATTAGRSPREIRRLYNIAGGLLDGPPRVWAERLAELTVVHGTSGFLLASDSAETIRRFAAEVVPAVRELVAVERGLA